MLAALSMPLLDDCREIVLPQINDPRGNLSFLQAEEQCPFIIERVFFLYGVPEKAHRAGHALRSCHQLIVAVSGGFDLVLHDGYASKRVRMDSPTRALHLPPMIWREVEYFSPGAVCLVLASEKFIESGYVRSPQEFAALRTER